jgi:hypothetical protein
VLQALIAADSQEQLPSRIPKAPGLFPCPIRDLRAKGFLQCATFLLVYSRPTLGLGQPLTNMNARKLQIN